VYSIFESSVKKRQQHPSTIDCIPFHWKHSKKRNVVCPNRGIENNNNNMYAAAGANNLNGSGGSHGRRQVMSSMDFYRRVPKDLTEVGVCLSEHFLLL
jgi:hypothetical protein